MFARRLQVLPDGEEIHIGGAQIVHHLQYFVSLLAEPNHDSRFGEDARIEFFGALQELDRGEVARAGAHREVLRRHGFKIMVEHIGPRRNHGLDRTGFAQEIRRQHLDRCLCAAGADGADHRGKMRRTAVVKVVPIDRGDDDMREPELRRRISDSRRLGRVERTG
jgi:hypothetical protein